jgi:CheY-like chemotaxis protein
MRPGLSCRSGTQIAPRAHVAGSPNPRSSHTALACSSSTLTTSRATRTPAGSRTSGHDRLRRRVVISDVPLPRLDGVSMVRRMRRIIGLRHVPVLFLTVRTSKGCVFTIDLPKQPLPTTSIRAHKRVPESGSVGSRGRTRA